MKILTIVSRIYRTPFPRCHRIVTAIADARPAEGLTIMTSIDDCDLYAIRIGRSVRVVVKATGDDPPVPTFAPAA